MPDPFPTAVVTGASRGFGRAISAALVAAGTHVVGIARDEGQLRTVRDELGEGFRPVTADATDDALAQDVIRTHRPTLLVLNAGVAPHMAPVHEQTWETFERTWQVDTRHVFTWTRAALRSRWRRAAWSSRCPAWAPWPGRRAAAGTPAPRPPSGSSAGTRPRSRPGPGWASGSSRCSRG